MRHLRLVATGVACCVAFSGATASAKTTLKFPNENAACVAQAWVPANTDPAESRLGLFVRDQAKTGEWGQVIRQQGCKL